MTSEQFHLLKKGESLEVDGQQVRIVDIRRVQHRDHLETRVYFGDGTWISSDSTSTVEAIRAA